MIKYHKVMSSIVKHAAIDSTQLGFLVLLTIHLKLLRHQILYYEL